ncbi:helix-turn-helix domain-containing protein [Rhodococcus hoagii]|nr:helix-turn-helix domain-containing protein [Prescottella equi]
MAERRSVTLGHISNPARRFLTIAVARRCVAEAGISRQCLSKWVNRYRTSGDAGLLDRASVPDNQPTTLDPALVAEIERLRREKKWSARRIAGELTVDGHRVSSIERRPVGLLIGVSRVDPRAATTDPGEEADQEGRSGVHDRQVKSKCVVYRGRRVIPRGVMRSGRV